MAGNRATFARGNLIAVWRDDQVPFIDETQIRRIYETIFVPALQADIIRLHRVMTGSLQRERTLNFDTYWNGLMEMKEEAGRQAIPDIDGLETSLDKAHRSFVARRVFEFRRLARGLVRDREETSLEPDHPDFLSARMRCIGYDTSVALRNIGERLVSERGRSALYVATLQGPDAVDELLTRQWVVERRAEDLKLLRESLYDCLASLKLAAQVRDIQTTRKDEPRADDIDEARRIATIRVVGGTTFRAA